jgi:hypothetical protein
MLIAYLDGPFEKMITAMKNFIAVDMAMIVTNQKTAIKAMTNISQLAAFFSAVTATTLQISIAENAGVLRSTTNFFYFASLFCSVAAAAQSVLCAMWRQSEEYAQDFLPFLILKLNSKAAAHLCGSYPTGRSFGC